VTINRPPMNTMTMKMHKDMGHIWEDLDRDASVRAIVLTGAGTAFSAGGDFEIVTYAQQGGEKLREVHDDTRALVYSMVRCSKPIVAAINGAAIGAGIAAAVCSDITIASETAILNDGHIRLGVACGDGACLIWPLLMGMARAKLYLLTGRFFTGKEAASMGFVSLAVPPAEVLVTALQVAAELAAGPQPAIRATKAALQHWLNIASFEHSCAAEMLTFTGQDVREGALAIKEKRSPRFPTATPQSKL